MLSSSVSQGAAVATLLVPGAKADTSAFTSSWVDVRSYEGDLVFIVAVGAVTAGQVALALEHAVDGSGTDAAAFTPTEGAFTTVTTSNDPMLQKRTYRAKATGGYVRVVGTVTTGPVDGAAILLAKPKYAT